MLSSGQDPWGTPTPAKPRPRVAPRVGGEVGRSGGQTLRGAPPAEGAWGSLSGSCGRRVGASPWEAA